MPHMELEDVRPGFNIHGGDAIEQCDRLTSDLLDRWQPLADWAQARAESHLDLSFKSAATGIAPRIAGHDLLGRRIAGLNFASHDALAFSSDPRVVAACCRAAEIHGVHSAGSAAQMGLTGITLELERRMAAFLGMAEAILFPTGWSAGQGTLRTLVGPEDHVVIDSLTEAGLIDAAMAATPNVHRFPHRSNAAVERRLEAIRRGRSNAGILVVTQALSPHEGTSPDVAALQAICRRHGAILLVDVAHDLGSLGETGRGVLEEQGMVGKVDVVIGTLSRAFASNGGFAASNHPGLKAALKVHAWPIAASSALAPMQAAAAVQSLAIAASAEGRTLRERLRINAVRLREGLIGHGFKVLGRPAATIPVVLGDNALARQMTSTLVANGGIINLLEAPAVPRDKARWVIQMMASHEDADIDQFVALAVEARAHAQMKVFGRLGYLR
ncbi:aminotransferase class I/II-fold pyridoxal phosphate-dependent enzyme [Ensifer soli]|uniref:aminotransferase class I/II-fold pyridoxal phosphate-dependent enzyme n=1 Tax=Ciceribacter sp. sgz301302 TaxID=3342379 RepID=UPI0035B8F1AB